MVRSCRRSGRLWMDRVEDEVLVQRVASGDERALLVLRPLRRTDLRDGVALPGRQGRPLRNWFRTFSPQCGRTRPASTPRGRALRRGCTASPATARRIRAARRIRTVEGEPLFERERRILSGDLSRNFDVAAALARLTPVHREVLVLAYFHGFSQREISDRTATPLVR